ncbi:ABC transporter ATP-binding protein [Pelagibacterium lacus]|uniref:ABC transporter ATP-binding protein n=1 Tax=Pelagibacterium lacus TaxID=2282655 RepID=A0A369W719_9HYPH|nr:ABC transporter ATP-binding protein [Pelagibacterium lacus]RDE10123.1 ABC transporter ATP-binding protein [Pelagibacterium lacus]
MASPSVPVLETRDLTIRFGGHVAVDAVSYSFRPGNLVAIVGPNGAGKTTYFNLISGQLRASGGAVLHKGEDITTLSVPDRTRRGIGRAFQLTNLFPRLSVLENVRLAVQALRPGAMGLFALADADAGTLEIAMGHIARCGLADRLDERAANLSHGDQRKLEVALLLALESEIVMFDEPTAGMSADEAPVILDLIKSIKADTGKTIILVEHKMDVIRSLADEIMVLHNGQLVASGEPGAVMGSQVVREAYLGTGLH